jgi:hypothetical protein
MSCSGEKIKQLKGGKIMEKTKFIVESVELKFSPNIYENPPHILVRNSYAVNLSDSHHVNLYESHVEENEIKLNIDSDNLKVRDKIKVVEDDGSTTNYFVKNIESFHIAPKHNEPYLETVVYLEPAISRYDEKEIVLTYHELCDLEERIISELNKQNKKCQELYQKNGDLNQKLQKLSKQAEKRKRILSFWKKPKF